jgi:hypothetical protein
MAASKQRAKGHEQATKDDEQVMKKRMPERMRK